MEIRQYVSLFLRWWWLLVLAVVLAGGAAFVTSKLQTPVYEATTTLLINQAPDTKTTDYTAILTSERLARTYSELLVRRPVLAETLTRLDLALDPEALAEAVTVELVRDTQLLKVSVEHPHPATAAAIANALVEVFAEQNEARQTGRFASSKERLAQEIESVRAQIDATSASIVKLGSPSGDLGMERLAQLGRDLAQYQQTYSSLVQTLEALRISEAQSTSNVVQVEAAAVPEDPIRPRTLVNTLLAMVVGAMLAVGMVILIDYLDDTIKTPEEVTSKLGLPLIGTIVKVNGEEGAKPYVAQAPRSPAAEAFRALRTNLQFAAVDGELRTLLVTSPDPEVGKSTVSANLAAIVAQGGKKVILLDIDLRRPRLHEVLGMTNSQGLSQLFKAPATRVKDVLRPTSVEGLSIVSTGELPPNPAELLGSARMAAILKDLAQLADMIVVDSPPAGIVTDPVVIAPKVDGVILVIEPGRTKLPIALHAVEALRQSGARMLGVVFNNVPSRRAGYYGAYRYQYAYESSGPDGREDGKRHRLRVKGKKESTSETAGD